MTCGVSTLADGESMNRWSVFGVAFALLVSCFVSLSAAAVPVGYPAFQRVWDRTDKPVADGKAVRSWLWGPEALKPTTYEPYQQAPNGRRLVQYFDKSRMEITDPNGDPTSQWYVTNG